ncbi:MAG: V-type ATP synthase subunit F [Oscillospiraceae bacterium]|nr:V-type ATP synthase subunit F [Oscillospiraceae bacterium]MBQ2743222.1 V-type ATP synthase subunit F [Oscillospiraceae bacterium]MBQ3224471.1 V-type ATP synthase subunit F [Oscillospiraceae bacterium]MBQ4316270.1 V-type ATP synthase subunit F [Oscillospiraceae bacterium]MBQ6698773.1 V-type ATP synthase subunit F [Oscillospiraceae bacterium]
MAMGYKLAVLGDRMSVLGYRTLGFTVKACETADEAKKSLHSLAKEGFAVIYITEQLAEKIPEEIAKYKDSPLPAVILVPGKGGSLGIGMKNVHDAVERAVGADILA